QAVTCDDFAQCMADANPGTPLAQHLEIFKRWYSQSGTPELEASGHYDAAARTYTLTLKQSCPATPGQTEKQPFLIPVRMGLVGPDGRDMPLQLDGETGDQPVTERVLVMTEAEQQWVFVNVPSQPVPSLLRQFSAPVWLDVTDADEASQLHLLAHDSDAFNRWEAAQTLMLEQATDAVDTDGEAPTNIFNDATLQALREVLRNPGLDAAFKTLVLSLPDEEEMADELEENIDPQRIKTVSEALRQQVAHALHDDWLAAYEANHNTGAYQTDPVSVGRRALANLALENLCRVAHDTGDTVWPGKAYQRFKDATNMTDRMGALEALLAGHSPLAEQALQRFYQMFVHEPLVIDKWFELHAGRNDKDGGVLAHVRQLMQHKDYRLTNPNRVRALLFSYFHGNPGAFHRKDAAGYVLWADQVLALDAVNAQIASDLARAMDHWKRLAEPYRSAAKEALGRVAAKPDLSADVREVVQRALA
ncbi:MAG: DUF3458 domain-containing protein, partial [Brachymonas sp.]|nr:DUF3458 domain-containing protein [Brachymonas sp.]